VGERARFLRFVAAGGTAAGVNIVSRIIFSTAMPFEAAVLLAYGLGMIVAFTLNRSLVFEPSGRSVRDESTRFILVNAIAAAQVWVVSVALARLVFPAIGFIWNAETIAHVVGVLSPVFTSYLGHKHISFGAKR
jgi:putative flippase GtrA